jgi:hypothetical protein
MVPLLSPVIKIKRMRSYGNVTYSYRALASCFDICSVSQIKLCFGGNTMMYRVKGSHEGSLCLKKNILIPFIYKLQKVRIINE